MKFSISHIIYGSLSHYRKQAFYQLIIVAILASVITGSLLTGYSVRESLKKNVSEKLGNSDVIISSGLRYFAPSLAERFQKSANLKCTPVFTAEGICQNFATGSKLLRTKIFGTGDHFFEFNSAGKRIIEEGSAAVNRNLAEKLGLKTGDEVILTLPSISDIPASSPFAPSKDNTTKLVLKISTILPPDSCGNFSLDITQAAPANIFVNINDLYRSDGGKVKTNVILIRNPGDLSEDRISGDLKNSITPDDIGLSARYSEKSGESEIISSRVFLDREIIDQVEKAVPEARPVITYLVNSISLNGRSTPYSFISALDVKSLPALRPGNSIIVNRWLADDISASEKDSVTLTWYNPGKISELEEKSEKFVVIGITEISGISADSLLMPDFPGISGRESCSSWDAGVEIKMDRIRKKDEDYWNRYRGTPKAFISYEKGKEIWGSNFGPATAIRFGAPVKPEQIIAGLTGKIDALRSGFTIRNIRREMIKAADESVDFGTLFLSLGFFIIVSSVFLLVLAVKSWFDARKGQVFSMFALGFRNSYIRRFLICETGIIALAGSLAGVVSGMLVNYAIVKALNSVWRGAVQTDTISAFPGIMPVIIGFITTFSIALIVLWLLIGRFLRRLTEPEAGKNRSASPKANLIFTLVSGSAAIGFLALYLFTDSSSMVLSFTSGGLLFVFLMMIWRQMLLSGKISSENFISSGYYRFHPGRLLMPVMLIAAGLFAVVITGINRMQANSGSLESKGGTGGYNIWAETTVPVREDMNGLRGIKALGLEDFEGKFSVVQAKRSSGDDASCLNLNHVTSPPLLGIDPAGFIKNGSFSFASLLPEADRKNPWEIITRKVKGNVIFGFADQTVLEWGLKKKVSDTLIFRSESGELFRMVIAGGLKASVFQGSIITDSRWISEYFPSVSGNSVFLFKCEDTIFNQFSDAIRTRLDPFGVSVSPAVEKLEGYYQVTNTYLSVFTVLGGFGIILGVAGLGFVLRFNYNLRRKEFALMLASGFTESNLRKIIFGEQVFIILAGILTGLISGIVSTLPSISSGGGVQWLSLLAITSAIGVTGIISLSVAVRSLRDISLTASLRTD